MEFCFTDVLYNLPSTCLSNEPFKESKSLSKNKKAAAVSEAFGSMILLAKNKNVINF